MEEKYDALMLRAIDYKDNDKLLTLFAAGKGKITATCRGVRKSSAKLKFAAEPFCFAEYLFAQRSGRYTVTSAYQHNGFYQLREDVAKFYAASSVLEICDKLLAEDAPDDELFVAAVRTLGDMCEQDEGLPLLKFLLKALSLGGYEIDLGNCIDCGEPIGETPYFHFARGGFCCKNCPTETRVSEVTYRTLRRITAADDLLQIPQEEQKDGEKRALRLLKEYFTLKTESKIDCLAEYIRLI